jgi:hypothetical protein
VLEHVPQGDQVKGVIEVSGIAHNSIRRDRSLARPWVDVAAPRIPAAIERPAHEVADAAPDVEESSRARPHECLPLPIPAAPERVLLGAGFHAVRPIMGTFDRLGHARSADPARVVRRPPTRWAEVSGTARTCRHGVGHDEPPQFRMASSGYASKLRSWMVTTPGT